MGETHDVAGYVVCDGCRNNIVLDVVARRTGNLCTDCLVANQGPLREIEIEARGTRLAIPAHPARKRQKRKPTPEAKARDRVVDACKDRARKRLVALFPDLYDILLAEERANAGLEPWPLQAAVKAGPDPDGSQTVDFALLYHALDDRGVDA